MCVFEVGCKIVIRIGEWFLVMWPSDVNFGWFRVVLVGFG